MARPRVAAPTANRVVLISHRSVAPSEPEHAPPPALHQAVVAKTQPAPAQPLAARSTQEIVAATPDTLAIPTANPQTAHRDQSDIVNDYRQALFEKLAAQRHYPEAARLRHYQGDGAILFRIDRGGKLLAASMERSTGRALLDRAALSQVQRAAPFPEIPPELPDELAVSMQLQFLILLPSRQMAAR